MKAIPPGPAEEAPSKSQLKREAHKLFELGRELVQLPSARLDRLALDDRLRSAVDEARAMRSHGARKRQLQFIAKLLRGMDATPVREALDSLRQAARQEATRHHRVESWRDHLLTGGDEAMAGLMSARRDADPQRLRQLVRNAGREARLGKPPTAARRLFKLLRDMDDQAPLPPLTER